MALRRFFTVAVASFTLNEALFWALLKFTRLDYRVALVIVLCTVALATLLAGKFWAFADAD